MSEPIDTGAIAATGIRADQISPPAAIAAALGQQCPRGHDYAQRSEETARGPEMIVFCPACEPIDAAEAADD